MLFSPAFRRLHQLCRGFRFSRKASSQVTITVEQLEDRLVLSGTEFRTMNGLGNNQMMPDLGMAETPFLRMSPISYEDGFSYPRGSSPANNPDPNNIQQSDLPSARLISNVLHAQGENFLGPSPSIPSSRGLSAWVFQWGQFLDHDITLTPGQDVPAGNMDEDFPIPVPAGDPAFDPMGRGNVFIPFTRSLFVDGMGMNQAREQRNDITSFIDGSNVYGSDDQRAANLRTFNGGLLKTTMGPDGELLPFNSATFAGGFEENANSLGAAPSTLYVAGDERVNEQSGLIAVHSLFVREHNRKARELAAEDPSRSDEELYQLARKWVGALMQVITYNEFLPAVLGPNPLPRFTGYDPRVNPAINNIFATAGFRVGHTMLPLDLARTAPNGTPIAEGNLSLRDAFFNPPTVGDIGLEPYLRGLASQDQQEIDRFLVNDVRNFLFGPPGSGGMDLAALNIQRGREHGLPGYNEARRTFGLAPYNSYDDIAGQGIGTLLRRGYGINAQGADNIEQVDVWTGGLLEPHVPGTSLGPLFHAIWHDQFFRLRDGDRFFYRNHFTGEELRELESTTLADVIRRNSNITNLQDNVFFSTTVSAQVQVQTISSASGITSRDPLTGIWYIRNTADAGRTDTIPFAFGLPGWTPRRGDFDGNGSSGIGVADNTGITNPNGTVWFLSNSPTGAQVDITPFVYGGVGWVALTGDWDGNGSDTVGVVDTTLNTPFAMWYLRNANSSGMADSIVGFGLNHWIPVPGDWDGDGITTPGVFDPTTGTWYLRGSNDFNDGTMISFQFGGPGWTPVVGDWNGDGIETVGVVDSSGQWYLRNSNSAGTPDAGIFLYGMGHWKPLGGTIQAATFETASALQVENGPRTSVPVPGVTQEQLSTLTNITLSRLLASGVAPTTVRALQVGLHVVLQDLPGQALAATDPSSQTILIDGNAAGRGWFVDDTPLTDQEFFASTGLADNEFAEGRVDLLTVIARELALLHGATGNDPLLGNTLGVGERRLAGLPGLFG